MSSSSESDDRPFKEYRTADGWLVKEYTDPERGICTKLFTKTPCKLNSSFLKML